MIYFIAAGRLVPRDHRSPQILPKTVKIGYTENHDSLELRVNTLQTGNHLDLYPVAFGPGSLSEERALHLLHAEDRIRGEWFKITPVVLHSMARLGYVDRDGLRVSFSMPAKYMDPSKNGSTNLGIRKIVATWLEYLHPVISGYQHSKSVYDNQILREQMGLN